MENEMPKEWGYVDTDTVIRDSDGKEYVVDNQHGWVVLKSLTGAEPLKFEALDAIEPGKFQIVGEARKRRRR